MKLLILVSLTVLTSCADSVVCGAPKNFLLNEIKQEANTQVSQTTEK